MGQLIATTQATVDGVIDPVGEWVQADGDHGHYSFERQARSGGLVLGRKTFEGLAGYWPSQTGKWADMVNALPKYVGSNALSGHLEWNATLLNGDLEDSIPKLKNEVDGLQGRLHRRGATHRCRGRWTPQGGARRVPQACCTAVHRGRDHRACEPVLGGGAARFACGVSTSPTAGG
jgi:hypothetical protein